VLKPNAAEAMDATGTDTPLEAAAALIGAGARIVVCSLGSEGLLALERDDQAHGPPRAWRAQLPEPLSGNPTGAGDALVAALDSRRGWRRGCWLFRRPCPLSSPALSRSAPAR